MPTRETATLGDLLRYRAAATPDRTAFVFQSWRLDEPDEEELTYRGLLARSRAAADALKVRCRRRDRALILCPPGLDYIVSFFACQLAGLVAVPVYPPRNVQHMGRLRAIIEDAGASAILTPEKSAGRLMDLSRSGGPAAAVPLPPLIAVDLLDGADGAAAADSSDRAPGIGAADLTYLQYTSGTTGRPKGVMVSHAAALAQLKALQDRLQLDETDIGVFWLPLFHDMGLVGGMLQPLFSGFPCYMMAPTAFAQRPMSWLRTISRVRGTFSYAPNFAYDLCVSAFDPAAHGDGLDLSCWSFAGNASEIVRAATLQRFTDRFAPYGFVAESLSPCFGLAEFTLIATARTRRARPSAPAETASRDNRPAGGGERGDASGGAVGCGSIVDDHALKIVDPDTAVECAEGETGEVWLSGPSVAGGYWHRPEETGAAFGARLAEEPDSGPWLRTGDKGALTCGELRLLGRFKEMIIVRGRNHYAQDLEESVAEACPGLKRDRAAAFGVVVDPQGRAVAPDSTLAEGEERVVVIQELDRAGLRLGDTGAACDAMRRAITRDHEVEPHAVVLIKPATLPRTSSGKIERTRARTLFLSGGLAEVDRWQRPGD